MTIRVVLRVAAVAIAAAGLVDPSIRREISQAEPVTIVAMDARSLDVAVSLRDDLGMPAATVWRHDNSTAAAACPDNGGCVIVSSGEAPKRVTGGARVLGVLDVAATPGLLDRIGAPRRVHRDVTATLRVETTRVAKRIAIFDGDTLVGATEPQAQTAVDVPWVPIADGARVLRIEADHEVAHVGVVVAGEPVPVLFHEPQASWLGTFVRRALANDTRFSVRGRIHVAPAVAVSRGYAPNLDAASIESAGTVIVTAPELLSPADVDLLERFVVYRGGSAIVLGDRRPSGAALRLLPRVLDERRDAQPQSIGLLRAREWVMFEAGRGTSTLASAGSAAVVVSRALGRGRVIVSGVLDAWRYREASDRFDEFWTGLVWDASVMAGSRLRVETDRPIAQPGEPVTVKVESQSLGASEEMPATSISASGRVDCDDERQVLRLWPTATPGSFEGVFRSDHEGSCVISVRVEDEDARAPLTIRDDLLSLPRHGGGLDAIAVAHSALHVTEAQVPELVTRVREQSIARRVPFDDRPMRSPYWVIPFVVCLSGDWWLRRRSGLS